MTARTAARLGWSLCTGCVVGGGGVVVLQLLNGTSDLGWAPLPALLAFAVIGALVAARQPRNSVGWLLLAVAVCMTVRLVGESCRRTSRGAASLPDPPATRQQVQGVA